MCVLAKLCAKQTVETYEYISLCCCLFYINMSYLINMTQTHRYICIHLSDRHPSQRRPSTNDTLLTLPTLFSVPLTASEHRRRASFRIFPKHTTATLFQHNNIVDPFPARLDSIGPAIVVDAQRQVHQRSAPHIIIRLACAKQTQRERHGTKRFTYLYSSPDITEALAPLLVVCAVTCALFDLLHTTAINVGIATAEWRQ